MVYCKHLVKCEERGIPFISLSIRTLDGQGRRNKDGYFYTHFSITAKSSTMLNLILTYFSSRLRGLVLPPASLKGSPRAPVRPRASPWGPAHWGSSRAPALHRRHTRLGPRPRHRGPAARATRQTSCRWRRTPV